MASSIQYQYVQGHSRLVIKGSVDVTGLEHETIQAPEWFCQLVNDYLDGKVSLQDAAECIIDADPEDNGNYFEYVYYMVTGESLLQWPKVIEDAREQAEAFMF